jgi:hypothetical protein
MHLAADIDRDSESGTRTFRHQHGVRRWAGFLTAATLGDFTSKRGGKKRRMAVTGFSRCFISALYN